jgi:integrase
MRIQGSKNAKRVPLGDDKNPVATIAQAKLAMQKLCHGRLEGDLPVFGEKPKFRDFLPEYFAEVDRRNRNAEKPGSTDRLRRPATIAKERGSLANWAEHFGETRLNKITSEQIEAFIRSRQDEGMSNRTIMLDIIALRNVLKLAIKRKHIKAIPHIDTDELDWTTPTRELATAAEIERLCEAAVQPRLDPEVGEMVPLKNGQQFADYIRLMAYCGARRNEALRLKWSDVDFEHGQLAIGSDGLTKNHEQRVVDFNDRLEAHLKDMHARRAPDSVYLFPSPQRGDNDQSAKTFRESLKLVLAEMARQGAPLKSQKGNALNFGFHDCRHHFISYCVMSGIDFMTIAAWVGHKDGGILIGKVYGHLANEHRKMMAKRVVFTPQVIEGGKAAAV